jgi:hypothetical protein
MAAFYAVLETQLLCRGRTRQLQVNGDRHIITNHSSATVHTEVLAVHLGSGGPRQALAPSTVGSARLVEVRAIGSNIARGIPIPRVKSPSRGIAADCLKSRGADDS